jgi:DNA primase
MDKSWDKARSKSIHELLGIACNRRRIQICCPFPDHNDSSPSFSLFEDNGFKCYGCGKQGNGAVDFLIHMGFDKKQILEEFG